MQTMGGEGPLPHYLGQDPLIEQADFTARMLAGMPGIVFLYDAVSGKSLYQNRSLSGLLGYDADTSRELAGREWRALMHPEDIERFADHRAQLCTLAPGEQLLFEYRVRDAGGTYRWLLGRDAGYDGPGKRPGLIIGNAVDIDAQKRAEQRLDLLMHEFNHRVNNMHMMVSAIVSATYRSGGSDFLEIVSGRLKALAKGNAALLGGGGSESDLSEIVATAFAPFAAGNRISAAGPRTILSGTAASALALACNEMATNAVKYGALSTPEGRIAVDWRRTDDGLAIDWRETGGPPVTAPSRKGFGSRLIAESLSGVGGTVSLDWPLEGLRMTIRLPGDALANG